MRGFQRALTRFAVGIVMGATILGPFPAPAAFAEDAQDEIADPLPAETSPTPLFYATIRWGNVLGWPETREAVDMNGSVSVSSGTLELVRTLLFEAAEDAVTSVSGTQVVWTSRIHGHWDGVMLRGTAPKDATVTVAIGSTSVTKAVSEFVRLKKDVTDLDSGRELVIQAYPLREPAVVLQAFWGRVGHRQAVFTPDRVQSQPLMTLLGTEGAEGDADDAAEEAELDESENVIPPSVLNANFSGDLAITGATIRKAHAVAFEEAQGDLLGDPFGGTVAWTSTISGTELPAEWTLCAILRAANIAVPETIACPVARFDRDGIVVKARLSTLRDTTSFTIRFTDPSLNFSKTFTFKDLWHKKFLFEPVPVNGEPSGLGLVVQVHVLRSGQLVRARSDYRVFRVEDGVRRHFLSPEAFRLRGFAWEDIEEVDPEDVDSAPEGEPLDLPDGTPVKGHGPAVFVTSEVGLCPVASPRAFEAVGLKWEDVIPVPDATINARPKCKTIDGEEDLPNGALVRSSGAPTVYRVDNGALMPIPSPAVFEANGFRWDRVHEVAPGSLANRQVGGFVELPDGAVVRGSGPTVFVVEQGKRRPFVDAEDFVRSGLQWSGVRSVGDQVLAGLPLGTTVLR